MKSAFTALSDWFLYDLHHSVGTIAVSSDDLLYFYTVVIRPVFECVCVVWHHNLTASQSDKLESLQKRALRIIHGDSFRLISCFIVVLYLNCLCANLAYRLPELNKLTYLLTSQS